MTPSLAVTLAGIILIGLTAYVLLGGADFGGGVWALLASGPRKQAQRELIARAIGPVWEANHVWLILSLVLLFTCFPLVFARVAIGLHVPLTLMLIGIVLRGSAFVFQSYGEGSAAGRVFATASLITPVLLGVCVAAAATGAVPVEPRGSFVAVYVRPWLTAFGLAVGVFALACFALLAAVYLTLETRDLPLQEDFRRRALVTEVVVVGVAVVGLFLLPAALSIHPRVVALTAVTAASAIWSLWRRHYALARVAAAGQVALIVVGWGAAQYPYILPPDLTIQAAAAPRVTLELAFTAVIAGAVVLFPSLFYLMRVFKAQSKNAMR
ncbi:MAG TPA: cytochrome d ubiquinol oxidase subunit II [Gemmatimonadales bacterium]|nr:cytochrome d ubiquinol oxidase subunit II [Gemmatimonadales bacterium]